jgi:glutamate dehydrogenase
MQEVLKHLGIDPEKQLFTIKMSGGPDGDVAGNQLHNLFRFFPKTARLIALTDVSGTIRDLQGLDLEEIERLFQEGKPIRAYPASKLSEGGFLLDLQSKKEVTLYSQHTLLLKKKNGKLEEEWLSGNEMNHLFRSNVHHVKADIFIPAGGRPRTLNETNWKDFLDENGQPTARAIVEGANLYLTRTARRHLEEKGVLIIKDSSANKGGVICSSFEVLTGLTLSEEEFLSNKKQLVEEILKHIENCCRDEALLLLKNHEEKKQTVFLSDVSEQISEIINRYSYELLDYFEHIELSKDPNEPFIRCLLNYCPPFLVKNFSDRILKNIPDIHKKAIISCTIASRLVYKRGLNWSPSLIDVLPLIVCDGQICQRNL